jgi:hypothetical protein
MIQANHRFIDFIKVTTCLKRLAHSNNEYVDLNSLHLHLSTFEKYFDLMLLLAEIKSTHKYIYTYCMNTLIIII